MDPRKPPEDVVQPEKGLSLEHIKFIETKAANHTNLYEILGIAINATLPDIKKVYLKLSRQYHPDKWTGALAEMNAKVEQAKQRHETHDPLTKQERASYDAALDKFKEMKEAYEILSDNDRKLEYDRYYLRQKAAPAAPRTPEKKEVPKAAPPKPTEKIVLSSVDASFLYWHAYFLTKSMPFLISRGGAVLENAISHIGFKSKSKLTVEYDPTTDTHTLFFDDKKDLSEVKLQINFAAKTYYEEFIKSMNNTYVGTLRIKFEMTYDRLGTATSNLSTFLVISCQDKALLKRMIDVVNDIRPDLIVLDPSGTKATLNPANLGLDFDEPLAAIRMGVYTFVKDERSKAPSRAPQPSPGPRQQAPQPSNPPGGQPAFFEPETQSARPKTGPSILLYIASRGELAVKFPNKEMRDAFAQLIGVSELSDFQKTIYRGATTCPIILEGRDDVLFIPAVVSQNSETANSKLTVFFSSVDQRDKFYHHLGLPAYQTVSPHTKLSTLYFQDQKLFDTSSAYEANMKIPVPDIFHSQARRKPGAGQ